MTEFLEINRGHTNTFDLLPRRSESRNALAGTRYAIRIRRCCEVWALNSKSCRSCCVIQPCDQHWMSIPRRSRQPNLQRRQPCCRWCFRPKLAEPRSRRHLLTLQHDEACAEKSGLKGHKKGHENVPFWVLDGLREIGTTLLKRMAGTTRLELATSAVTATVGPIGHGRQGFVQRIVQRLR